MQKRFVSIWFRYLKTDAFSIRIPALRGQPFVLALPDHGRMRISAMNAKAAHFGIHSGMAVADARAIFPNVEVKNDMLDLSEKLLRKLALWCIRFTPVAVVDLPDGLILDASGCAHLWKGEENYLKTIIKKLNGLGFYCQIAIADTIGAAWAAARFGKDINIISPGKQLDFIQSLPPEALRIPPEKAARLHQLGLSQIRQFIAMPRRALQRRFGEQLLQRVDQATGSIAEYVQPVELPVEWSERLPCLELIVTRTGIEIALQHLLDILCMRLQKQQRGIRQCIFKCYRIDHQLVKIDIGTHRASVNTKHLYQLFEEKLSLIEPGLGIELFVLEAPVVDDLSATQQQCWNNAVGLKDQRITELIDRLTTRIKDENIFCYHPQEHFWPERSMKREHVFEDKTALTWKVDTPRPVYLLRPPQAIEVTAPIPDYPPMLFRYKNVLHKIIKADGPERIEREWWMDAGEHRDYYIVENEKGQRYWLFRSGHYSEEIKWKWFIHGFFA